LLIQHTIIHDLYIQLLFISYYSHFVGIYVRTELLPTLPGGQGSI